MKFNNEWKVIPVASNCFEMSMKCGMCDEQILDTLHPGCRKDSVLSGAMEHIEYVAGDEGWECIDGVWLCPVCLKPEPNDSAIVLTVVSIPMIKDAKVVLDRLTKARKDFVRANPDRWGGDSKKWDIVIAVAATQEFLEKFIEENEQ